MNIDATLKPVWSNISCKQVGRCACASDRLVTYFQTIHPEVTPSHVPETGDDGRRAVGDRPFLNLHAFRGPFPNCTHHLLAKCGTIQFSAFGPDDRRNDNHQSWSLRAKSIVRKTHQFFVIDGLPFAQGHGTDRNILVLHRLQGQAGHVTDGGVLAHRLFDLRRIDIDAVEDHHLIRPATIDQLSIFGHTTQVSGREPAITKKRPVRLRIPHKGVDHPWASKPDLPDLARCHGHSVRPQQPNFNARSGSSDCAGCRSNIFGASDRGRAKIIGSQANVKIRRQFTQDLAT